MKIKNNIAVSASGLVFNPDTGESFTVNPMGAEMLGYLAEGESQQEIEMKIAGKYNVDKSSFEKDFEDFVALLQTYSLLEND
ncbi:MAG: PqqD family protein [Bacteroidales bacterium]|nr:PqqD family protein [Bacteroidales bacterium]